MIVCPHCNHQNPEEAIQCEACYTPLPTTTNCPNCGAPVQTDATFCGQCGFNLKPESNAIDDIPETIVSSSKKPDGEFHQEEEHAVAPMQSMQSSLPNMAVTAAMGDSNGEPPESASKDWNVESSDPYGNNAATEPLPSESEAIVTPPPPDISLPDESETMEAETVESGLDSGPLTLPDLVSSPLSKPISTPPISSSLPPPPPVSAPSYPAGGGAPTRLQIQIASLFHVQTQTRIELPYTLSVIHLGKPNEQIPPDVDVSGFPDSEIVSRVHADIRVEGDIFYIEDMGSSNGTYINHTPLSQGNRHRLRSGDRISLGKGDRVTFIFQLS